MDTTRIHVCAVPPPPTPVPATYTPTQLYVETFQPFLNNIPQRDPAEVRAVMEEELGRPREEVFSTFEEKPIGCASIGQVGVSVRFRAATEADRAAPGHPRPPSRTAASFTIVRWQSSLAAIHATT